MRKVVTPIPSPVPTVAIWVYTNTAMKHPIPDRVKPPFVILTSGHSDAQG